MSTKIAAPAPCHAPSRAGALTIERALRSIAGAFVLASLALGVWWNRYWLLFTAFVGLNLLQSGFTNWCPMMSLLRRLGVPEVGRGHPSQASPVR
jgi:hypothetical protein